MVSLTTKALRLAARAKQRKDALMIERGIGYWISPVGEFIPAPHRMSHADVVRDLIDVASLNEDAADAFAVDPNAYVISQGWTRVRVYPDQRVAYVDYGTGQQRRHEPLVRDLIDGMGVGPMAIKHTDEHGNYVSP